MHAGSKARRLYAGAAEALTCCRGAQLAEFAVSLPLLVVFVVGIYDFGNAFNLRYKLATAAREAARFAANEPTADLSSPNATGTSTGSIAVIPKLVGNYLKSISVNDCGLSTIAAPSGPPTGLTWTYIATSGCPGPLTLTINRGYTFTANASPPIYSPGQTIEATQITISYPYVWQFTHVIKLIAPNSNYAANTLITTSATVPNLN